MEQPSAPEYGLNTISFSGGDWDGAIPLYSGIDNGFVLEPDIINAAHVFDHTNFQPTWDSWGQANTEYSGSFLRGMNTTYHCLQTSNYEQDAFRISVFGEPSHPRGVFRADGLELGQLARFISAEVDEADPEKQRQGTVNTADGSDDNPEKDRQIVRHSRGKRPLRTTVPVSSGGVQKGRKGPLPPHTRRQAADMRRVKACSNCRQRKAKCDPGKPCAACIRYFKSGLISNPCRGLKLQTLTKGLFADTLFPRGQPRSLEWLEFSPSEAFDIALNFGFGPPFRYQAVRVSCDDQQHQHVVYPWPPGPSAGPKRVEHSVMPIALAVTQDADLDRVVAKYIDELLEEKNFISFPSFASPLQILHIIHSFYQNPKGVGENDVVLLGNAFQLLVIIHVCRETTICWKDTPKESREALMPGYLGRDPGGKPCFIRSQLGKVLSARARNLMAAILGKLEEICLSQKEQHYPLILTTLAVLLMALEADQYHSAKIPYHADTCGHTHAPPVRPVASAIEESVDILLGFFSSCFPRHHPEKNSMSPVKIHGKSAECESTIGVIGRIRVALEQAEDYLEEKRKMRPDDSRDMSVFFDRFLARLFSRQI
ncbi:hypothetical protein EJ06DRAFT_27904 [Trichodelitschia bisporula]|uniref:Zn(2)-C6 fungal-type domain-containing protein n=1 Tax=Trichodelitschia bisporula TaxID=703511 RepID=A0A6G1IBS6_9PEZI|nr:hypothetical protein EJ06DRAFT_27904 [Trichodelitschia bisporula]